MPKLKLNKILHVGGPIDGARRLWPDPTSFSAQVVTRVPTSWTPPCYPSSLEETIGVRTDVYHLNQIPQHDKSLLQIALHSSVAHKDLLKMLVKGYRYQRSPKR